MKWLICSRSLFWIECICNISALYADLLSGTQKWYMSWIPICLPHLAIYYGVDVYVYLISLVTQEYRDDGFVDHAFSNFYLTNILRHPVKLWIVFLCTCLIRSVAFPQLKQLFPFPSNVILLLYDNVMMLWLITLVVRRIFLNLDAKIWEHIWIFA